MLSNLRKRILNWLIAGTVLAWLMDESDNVLNGQCEDRGSDDCRSAEQAEVAESARRGYAAADQNTIVPPARYLIITGKIDIWCDKYEFGPGGSYLSLFWRQEIGGEERAVVGCVYDSTFVIIDYGASITYETSEQLDTDISNLLTEDASNEGDVMSSDRKSTTSRRSSGISAYA